MGKGKLAKFADMETYENVFQYPYSVVEHVPFEMNRGTGEALSTDEFHRRGHQGRPYVDRGYAGAE